MGEVWRSMFWFGGFHQKQREATPGWPMGAGWDLCCEQGGLQRAGRGCVEGGNWREETSGEGDGEMGVFARYLGDRTSRTW